jgi:hypothetical protein
MKKHSGTEQGMICECGGKVVVTVAQVRNGKMPLRCADCEKAATAVNPAPLSLPVELMPGRCPCPKRRIDGVLYKAHRPDCAALGLFTDKWPMRGQSITHNGVNLNGAKAHIPAA